MRRFLQVISYRGRATFFRVTSCNSGINRTKHQTKHFTFGERSEGTEIRAGLFMLTPHTVQGAQAAAHVLSLLSDEVQADGTRYKDHHMCPYLQIWTTAPSDTVLSSLINTPPDSSTVLGEAVSDSLLLLPSSLLHHLKSVLILLSHQHPLRVGMSTKLSNTKCFLYHWAVRSEISSMLGSGEQL